MSDILISGYYGFKNSGDDALLLAIIRDLKEYKKDIDLKVLSASPLETQKTYGVEAINRMSPFGILKGILGTKMLVSGGGTLIQDGTSTKSLIYYLTIITLAKLFGKKVMLYSNGIGPLCEKNKKFTKRILNMADIITLRDSASRDELLKMGVKKPKIYLTADPAFSLECDNAGVGEKMLADCGINKGDKYICISVRNFKNMPDDFTKRISRTADEIYEKYGFSTLLLPMQYPKDYAILEEIKSLMKTDAKIIKGYLDISAMLDIIKNAELVIGMRLHSLIYGASLSVAVIGLVYDVKVASFMDYINQKYYKDAKTVTSQELFQMTEEILENKEKIISELEKNSSELKQKSKENAKLAIGLLEK